MRLRNVRKKVVSYVRSQEDPVKKRISWGKYLYLGILAIFVFWLVKKGFDRGIYIQGDGVFDAYTINVASSVSARITGLNFKPGDEVLRGTPLVTVDTAELTYKLASFHRDFVIKSASFKKDIYEAESEIKLLNGKIRNCEKNISMLEKEYERVKKLVTLGTLTRPSLMLLQDNIEAARDELSILTIMAGSGKEKLALLQNELSNFMSATQNESDKITKLITDAALLTPVNSIVIGVYKKEGEVAETGETILRLADLSTSFLKTYFDVSYESSLKTGDDVGVEFASGEKTSGKIRKIYLETLSLPAEYRRQYSPPEKYIAAEISIDNKELMHRIIGSKARVYVKRRLFN